MLPALAGTPSDEGLDERFEFVGSHLGQDRCRRMELSLGPAGSMVLQIDQLPFLQNGRWIFFWIQYSHAPPRTS